MASSFEMPIVTVVDEVVKMLHSLLKIKWSITYARADFHFSFLSAVGLFRS
jgi:hypothetical protein